MDKQSLDRYLTSEPPNHFQDWCEAVYNCIPTDQISDNDLDKHDQWINDKLNEYCKHSFPAPPIAASRLIREFKHMNNEIN